MIQKEVLEQMIPFDPSVIRDKFPALSRRHNGFPVAYFDGPGGTQVPLSVIEAMADYLINHNANTHWGYPTSEETDQEISMARSIYADFFNCGQREIVFGQNMTTLTFHLTRCLADVFNPGDEIIVTELDHHANIDPWLRLEKERGVVIKWITLDPETLTLNLDDLDRHLSERTKLVAVGAASNAFGTINDLKTISEKARRAGALFFVDAVHFAPHSLIDVKELGCDFLVCSAYKFYGPHIGIMYVSEKIADRLNPAKVRPASDALPENLETGTLSHEAITGARKAVEFIAGCGFGESLRERLSSAYARINAKDHYLTDLLLDRLGKIESIRIYGPPAGYPRTGLVSLTVGNSPSSQISQKLAEKGLFLSHGNFYAKTALERLGLDSQGLLRIGLSIYSDEEEVSRLLDELEKLAADAG